MDKMRVVVTLFGMNTMKVYFVYLYQDARTSLLNDRNIEINKGKTFERV